MILIKSTAEQQLMRQCGQRLRAIMQALRSEIVVGMSTGDIDRLATKLIKEHDSEPVLLGYNGFPKTICVSLNEEVVHGIPNDQRLIKDGDLVSLDLCIGYKGLITDTAFTIAVGNQPAAKIRQLLEDTEHSLQRGIEAIKPGATVGDIGEAIGSFLKPKNYGIIEALVGHGVGFSVHEEPEVPNVGVNGRGPRLRPGMAIAIEPMVTLGSKEVYLERDGWTIKSMDHSLSAHFEHTVLITKQGYEVLT